MILIGTDEGIYRWFEGCGWPIFHSLQDHAIVDLASPGAGLLAAIDRDGQILESVNNGQDWQVIPGPEGSVKPQAMAVWGEAATIVLATRPLGFYRRVLGAPLPRPGSSAPATTRFGLAPALFGRAMTLAEGATALVRPRRHAMEPGGPGTAAVWGTLGRPAVAKGKIEAAAAVQAMAIGGGTPAPWFAAIKGAGLWRSLDDGTSWQQCPGLPETVLALRTVPTKPGHVIAATADGCRFSSDNGQTWEDRGAGLEDARHVAAVEVKPGDPDTLLVGASSRAPGADPAEGRGFTLYESNNGGKSWTRVKHGFPEDIAHDVITDIRYDPSAPENVVVALGSGELWVSRNEGFYWSPLARQIKAARVLCAVG